MIRFLCDCGNEDPKGFDIYMSQNDMCGILTVICKNCGEMVEDFIACNRDSFVWKN